MPPDSSQDTYEALCIQHPGYITDHLPECPYHRNSTRVGLDSLPQSSSPLSDSLFYSFTYSTDPLQSPHCVHMRAGTKFGELILWGESKSTAGDGFRLGLRAPFGWCCGGDVCNPFCWGSSSLGERSTVVWAEDCWELIGMGSVLASCANDRLSSLPKVEVAHSSPKGTNISTSCGICSASSRAGYTFSKSCERRKGNQP